MLCLKFPEIQNTTLYACYFQKYKILPYMHVLLSPKSVTDDNACEIHSGKITLLPIPPTLHTHM